MEILSFIDPSSGKSLYMIGPFADKQEAMSASASLSQPSAQPQPLAHAAKRPNGPITKRCWDIFDLLSDSQDKPALIAACEKQGILRGTAIAQYSRWKAAKRPVRGESA